MVYTCERGDVQRAEMGRKTTAANERILLSTLTDEDGGQSSSVEEIRAQAEAEVRPLN